MMKIINGGSVYIPDEWLREYTAKVKNETIQEIETAMHNAYRGTSCDWECMVFDLVIKGIKEQKNE